MERPFVLRILAAGGARVVMPEQMDAVDVTGGRRWTSEGAGVELTLLTAPGELGSQRIRIALRNTGQQSLQIDVYAPLLGGLATAGYVAYLPRSAGAVMPLSGIDYTEYHLGGLAALFAILQHPDGGGVVLGHEKTPEDEGRYRSGVHLHGKGVAGKPFEPAARGTPWSLVETESKAEVEQDLGGVASFVENLELPAGGTMELGPYIMAPYDGTWMDGAATLRALRRARPMRTWPAWMRPVRNIGTACMWHRTLERFGDYPEWVDREYLNPDIGTPVAMIMHWNWLPRRDPKFWWAYSLHCPADPHFGTDADLKQAIADARKRGIRTQLYTSFCTIGIDGPHRDMFLERNWVMHPDRGRDKHILDYGPLGDFVMPCVALPEVRRWIVDGLLNIMRTYEPDGLFIDETAAVQYRTCFNPAHRHEHPYVWTWGVYQILRDLRRELDAFAPDAFITLEGSSEMMREFVDGYWCHSFSFTGMTHTAPVLRAVTGGCGLFESSLQPGGASKEKDVWVGAHQFAFGEHYHVMDHRRPELAQHHRYRVAYPEMFGGQLMRQLPTFTADVSASIVFPNLVGCLFECRGKKVLTMANPADVSYDWWHFITLPFKAKALYDRVRGRIIDLDAHSRARIAVRGYEVRAFEVIE